MNIQERIEDYLSSYDLELVELGASLMKGAIDKSEWRDTLDKCFKYENGTYYINGRKTITSPYGQKWAYRISEEDEIEIYNPWTYGTQSTVSGFFSSTISTVSTNMTTFSIGNCSITSTNVISPLYSGTTYTI